MLEWCVLLLCVGLVMSAELFNSAFESLARAVTRDFDDDVQDALDIMVNAYYEGAESLILYEMNLGPEFFELRTGVAGEIMQKFANYGSVVEDSIFAQQRQADLRLAEIQAQRALRKAKGVS